MSHQLIRYQPEHRQEAGRLLTEFWPDPAVGAAQIAWLHEQNPYTDHPFIYLVIIDGKIVGMRAFFGARYEITGTGETFDAVCGTMFVTDESIRGQGFATKIMEGALKDIAAEGYRYVFSYSARPIPYMSQLRRGWHVVGDYRMMGPQKKPDNAGLRHTVARRLPLLRKLWRRTGRRLLPEKKHAFAALDALMPGKPPHEADGRTLSISRDADAPAMARLAKATAIPGLIRHVRDQKYFAWRYRNNRMDYRFIYLRDTELRGFMVLQKWHDVADIVRIADWEATDEQTLKDLFRVALESGKFTNLRIWSAALPEEIVSYLRDNKFTVLDGSKGVAGYTPGFMIKSLRDNPEDGRPGGDWEVSGRRIDDLANWDLRPVFSDQF